MTQRSVTLYGLANCDSCRKARAWLIENGIAVTSHDLRKDGVPQERLRSWLHVVGWQQLLNRRSSTWRQLDAATRDIVVDADTALALLLAHPTAIKRPVLEWSAGTPQVTVGFTPDAWQR